MWDLERERERDYIYEREDEEEEETRTVPETRKDHRAVHKLPNPNVLPDRHRRE